MIIGCTGNYRKTEYYNILEKIHKYYKSKNIIINVSDDFKRDSNYIIDKSYSIVPFDVIADKSDIIFAIGGDGTILSTVRRLGKYQKPILGIHIGGLGFLSECNYENLKESLKYIINNNYKISERMILEARVKLNKKDKKYWALNDIIIDHGPSARILKTEVNVSGHYLNMFEGDGLIISTPTGSTAYSLSAGGPIIYPSVDTLTVTPICPHSLSARPIVLKSTENLSVSCPEMNNDIALAIDGQIRLLLNGQSSISINRAQHNAKLIVLPITSYFKRLRTKMGWLGKVR